MKPFDTKGSCTPVDHDPFGILSKRCHRPHGGDMTARAPIYTLTATNDGVVEDLFEDELGNVVVDDALESLALNQ